jgi:type I restriction enzyme S subunit
MSSHWKAFKDVATLQRGFDLPTQDRLPGDVPVVASNGVVGTHNLSRVEAPGVVTGRSGTIGKVVFIETPFWPLNTTLFVKDFKGNLPAFVRYLLEGMNLASHAGGSTVPSLNRNVLDEILVYCPPLSVQRRIVDLMEHLDNQVNRLNEEQKAALTYLRLRRHILLTADEALPASQMFDIRIGRQRSPSRANGPGMTPYLRAANVKDGYLDLSDVMSMDFDADEREKFALRPGDVLVSEGSGSRDAVGACAVVDQVPGDVVCFQNTLLRYRAVPGRSLSGFVRHYCRWAYESGAFREVATGTNILHIGARRSLLMPVPLLSLDAQVDLADELDELEALQGGLRAEAQRAATCRDRVLTEVLSANLRIPDTYDELLGVAS